MESSGFSGRIYDRLRATLPAADVFMDVESIEPGQNWRSSLAQRIAASDAVLVLIGPQWLSLTDGEGRRRLDDPGDVTRWEIETALNQGKRVLPVLIAGAPPLQSAQLPPSLSPLAALHAIEIRHESFDAGIETLITALTGRRLRDEVKLARGSLMLERAKRWSTPVIGLMFVLLAWTRLFDLLTLDTRAATWTLALADSISPLPLNDAIVLVGIGKENDAYDPQLRARYAALLLQLARAGTRAAVMDIHFHAQRDTDETLADAMRTARASGTEVFVSFVETIGDKPRSTPVIGAAVSGLGLACAGRRLGYAVSLPLAFDVRHTAEGWSASPLPSLALLGAFGRANIAAIDGATDSLNVNLERARTIQTGFSLLAGEIRGKQACAALTPGTRTAELMLRATPLEALRARRVAFEDVLAGRISADRLAAKTVVIGFETPEETFMIARGFQRENRFGYELQADAINMLKSGRVTRLVGAGAQALLSVILAALGAALAVKIRRLARSKRSLIVSAIGLAYAGTAIALAASEDLLLNSVYDLSAFVFAYVLFRHLALRWLP